MPVSPTYPGVYVQEVPSAVRTIAGVATSITLFIGRAGKGPLNLPVRCLSYTDFLRTFSDDSSVGDLARYAKLFFLNGGTDCYVLRIADGATSAEVTLENEDGAGVLRLVAKQPGVTGETIRALVTYAGQNPEATFNLTLFRRLTNAFGQQVEVDREEWKNLSMDPASPLYAPDFLTQESKLVDAEEAAGIPATTAGFSQSGRPVTFTTATPTTLRGAWEDLIGDDPGAIGNRFQISVDNLPFVTADLSGIDVGAISAATIDTVRAGLTAAIQDAIEDAYTTAGHPGTSVEVQLLRAGAPALAAGQDTTLLRITSTQADGSVFIRPATTADIAVALMLGTEQGGLEVGAFAARRPAPTGITLRLANDGTINAGGTFTADGTWNGLARRRQDSITAVVLENQQPDGTFAPVAVPVDLVTTAAAEPCYRDDLPSSATDNNDGVREKLGLIRDAVNDFAAANSATFFWRAELWGLRLAILPTRRIDNFIGTFSTQPVAGDIETVTAGSVLRNVRTYTVGVGGTAGQQQPAAAVAQDGDPPLLADYEEAFRIADREIDLFNLMVLPPDRAPAVALETLWGPASVFCQQRRAFLVMDPPAAWDSAQAGSTGVAALRTGLVKDHAAVFFPRLVVNDGGLEVKVGPAGAIAGLAARIDGTRGVWKAPAGTEADLRGIVGLERRFSDLENGILNQRAVNTIRIFPNGIVNWGARTMDGDDDFASQWKYIPIRRLALYIEESLYRGLKWTVFEPNDEPLWSQIRLNVGAFMQGLFRNGAFQGTQPKDAYFVKVDTETTTETDRNLGIVNIWVGFAPLKPAEFVILYLQQMAGQTAA